MDRYGGFKTTDMNILIRHIHRQIYLTWSIRFRDPSRQKVREPGDDWATRQILALFSHEPWNRHFFILTENATTLDVEQTRLNLAEDIVLSREYLPGRYVSHAFSSHFVSWYLLEDIPISAMSCALIFSVLAYSQAHWTENSPWSIIRAIKKLHPHQPFNGPCEFQTQPHRSRCHISMDNITPTPLLSTSESPVFSSFSLHLRRRTRNDT